MIIPGKYRNSILTCLLIICGGAVYNISAQYDITIASEMRDILKSDFDLWYPRVLDTLNGGYYSDLNYRWEISGPQNKMIVSQARHIWSASKAAVFYNNNYFLKIAKHGYDFLKTRMWDSQYGGFYDMVSKSGEPLKENNKIVKRSYGNAFAIFGLTEYYNASHDTSALELAKNTFYWLDKHSYDTVNGGYYQFIEKNGTALQEGFGFYPPKDHNSSIHILEAFTELYKIWPDELLRERLYSLLHIIRDKIVTDKGYMNLFFKKDWTSVSYIDSSIAVRKRNLELDHISFGHDIETAYLMLEASRALEIQNDTTTLITAQRMVDHTIKYGYDATSSGIFDGGYYFKDSKVPEIVRNTKEWWAQAEALNSLLLFSELFPDQKEYYEKFITQWNYIKKYSIDHVYGGWYYKGKDTGEIYTSSPKATIWKVNYHTTRSLINCINILEKKNSDQINRIRQNEKN